MNWRNRACVLALTIGLAACSSSASSSPSSSSGNATATVQTTSAAAAPRTDVCALLEPAEVASALGGASAAPGTPRGGAGWIEAQCEWTAGDASVSLALGSSASLAAKGVTVPLAEYVAQRRQSESARLPTADVTGVGDGGYVLTGRAPTALVYRGDVLVQLIAFSKAGAVPVDVATTLAGTALERATR